MLMREATVLFCTCGRGEGDDTIFLMVERHWDSSAKYSRFGFRLGILEEPG